MKILGSIECTSTSFNSKRVILCVTKTNMFCNSLEGISRSWTITFHSWRKSYTCSQTFDFCLIQQENERGGPDHQCGPIQLRGPIDFGGPKVPLLFFITLRKKNQNEFEKKKKQNKFFLIVSAQCQYLRFVTMAVITLFNTF